MSTSESESGYGGEPLPQRVVGRVKQYNDDRGYGFIRVNDTYKSVFFHISAVSKKCIKVGDAVKFYLVVGPKGYFAKSIEVLNYDDNDDDNDDYNESESEYEEQPLPQRVVGRVKQYNDDRGYGFIRVNDTYKSVFFHISAVPKKCIKVGDAVKFNLVVGPKGYFAESIEVLNKEDHQDDNDDDNESESGEELFQQGEYEVVQYND